MRDDPDAVRDGAPAGRSRRAAHRIAQAALVALAAVLLGVLADRVLQRFPHSADEYAYLYQARTFAAGRLRNPPAPAPEAYAPMHVISTSEAMYSKYPPGWPALLALGVAVGADFLVNPLLALLTLGLAGWLGGALGGVRGGLVTLALLATNPYFLLNGASWYAHPLVALAALGCVVALWRYDTAPRTSVALCAAAGLTAVALARPQDAVLLAVGLLPGSILLLRRAPAGRVRRDLSAAAVLPLSGLAVYALYNLATNGSPFLLGHQVFARGDLPALDALGSLRTLFGRLGEYLIWSPVAALAVLALLPGRASSVPAPADRSGDPKLLAWLLGPVAVVFWLGYAAYGALDFPPRYGPRYVLPVHVGVVLLAALALVRRLPPRWLWGVTTTVALLQLAHLALLAESLHTTLDAARGIYRAADALERVIAPREAIVVVAGSSGSVPYYDLVRNDLDYESPVLFVRGSAPREPDPERSVYIWDDAGGVPLLWTTDPGEPVRAVAATRPRARVVKGPGQPGWLRTRGSNACAERVLELPGQRPAAWAAFGPCPEDGPTELGLVSWPGDRGSLPAASHVEYRSFFRPPTPGVYTFRLESPAECVLRVAGLPTVELWDEAAAKSPTGRPGPGPRAGVASRELRAGAHPVSLSCATGAVDASVALGVEDAAGRPVARERFGTRPRRATGATSSEDGARP